MVIISIFLSFELIYKHEECNLELFLLKWLVFVPHMILSKHHYLVVKPTTTSLHKSLIFQPYLLDHQRKLILVVGRNFMNIKMMGNKSFMILGLYFFPRKILQKCLAFSISFNNLWNWVLCTRNLKHVISTLATQKDSTMFSSFCVNFVESTNILSNDSQNFLVYNEKVSLS